MRALKVISMGLMFSLVSGVGVTHASDCTTVSVSLDAKTLGAGDETPEPRRSRIMQRDTDAANRQVKRDWQKEVAKTCPGYIPLWRRATHRSIESDQAMGGRFTLTATANPRKR